MGRFLPPAELVSRSTFCDQQSSRGKGRYSDGPFKKGMGRFRKAKRKLFGHPFHRSNLNWDALFLAGTAVHRDRIGRQQSADGESSQVRAGIFPGSGSHGTSASRRNSLAFRHGNAQDHDREKGRS